MRTSTKWILGVIGAVVAIGIIGALAGGGDSKKDATVSATKGEAATTTKPADTAVKYKFRVAGITCDTDSLNTRTCKGTVTNISDKPITDAKPVMHWKGGTDSDLGSVDINPILPGQTAQFTTFTLSANPQITAFTIGFKKIFGKESDFPVEPLAP